MGYMDQVLAQVGEDATLVKITSETVDKWGHSDETTEEQEIHGKFEVMSSDMDEVEQGDFSEGDLRVFVHTRWESDISKDYNIKYGGRTYSIESIEKKRLDHNNQHLELRASPE